jgi:hypothetical protein
VITNRQREEAAGKLLTANTSSRYFIAIAFSLFYFAWLSTLSLISSTALLTCIAIATERSVILALCASKLQVDPRLEVLRRFGRGIARLIVEN